MSSIAAGLIGFVYGVAIAGMAFIIAGGGHGWCSTLISAVGVILLPFVGVAWVRRGRKMAVIAIVAGLISDIAIVFATAREGVEYVERIFKTLPFFVLAWLALWLAWQISVIIALVRGTFTSRPNI